MTNSEIQKLAEANARRANEVLNQSGIAEIWRDSGCRVNLIGSLKMGLLMTHRDIDLHVYSKDITEASSFAIAAKMATDPRISEIKCINGLQTEEQCIAWHVTFRADDGENWQFDIIHIEEGSTYDGFFERMADRIVEAMTPQQRDTIIKLKYETTPEYDYHGVEYYEAVIADGVSTIDELHAWIATHRRKPPYYWMP